MKKRITQKTVERWIHSWIENDTLQEKLSHYVENSIQSIHEGYTTSRLFSIPLYFTNSRTSRMDCSEIFHNDKWFRNILTHKHNIRVGRPFYSDKSIYYDEILQWLCDRIIEVESEWDF